MISRRRSWRGAGGSNPAGRVGLALLLILAWPGNLQAQGLSERLSLEAIFQVDLDTYADPDFRWTTDGATQAALNDALTELKEGSAERSVLMFEDACRMDSTFWPSRYYYAVSLRQTAQFEKAKQQLERLIREEKRFPEVYLEYGRLLQQEQQPDKAKDQFQKAIKLNPKFAKAYYALGVVFAFNGDLGRARKSFDKCTDLDPSAAEAFYGLAMLKLFTTRKVSHFDFGLLNQALQADSTYRPALFWRGFLTADRGDYQGALRDWNRLIRMSPGNPFLLNMRGYLYIDLERYEDAFADFKKAILLNRASDSRYLTGRTPIDKWVDLQNALNYINAKGYGLGDRSFFHLRKGVCFMVVDRHHDALESLNASLREEPSASAYLLKAILFEKTHNEDSAQACFVLSLRYDKDLFDAHKKRALHFVAKNDWKSSYREFNEMKRINPEAVVTYRMSGLLKSNFMDYFGCIIDLARVLKEDTTDAEAWHARALCRSQVKDHKGALEDIHHAARLEPDNKTYSITLSRLQLTAGDTLLALGTIQKVSNRYPFDCDVLIALSELQYLNRSLDQAIFTANLALKNLEQSKCEKQILLGMRQRARALYISALILDQRRQPDQALAKLNQSLALIMDHDRLFDRFLLLLRMNRKDEALRDLRSLQNANYERAASYYTEYLK